MALYAGKRGDSHNWELFIAEKPKDDRKIDLTAVAIANGYIKAKGPFSSRESALEAVRGGI